MGYPCVAFELDDPVEAMKHFDLEMVIHYGEQAYGHLLYVWDEGYRHLCRCKKCGGYVLIQNSEFHGMCDDDSYYTDYYPVSGEEEADQINQKYNGFELENKFEKKFLMHTNDVVHFRQK